MRIAVLALQGAFAEHERMFQELGVQTMEIRQRRDLDQGFDGLVIPGGESTVQGKLLDDLGLLEPLRQRIEDGLPVWGTCAGLILLAKQIENEQRSYLATMDTVAVRNAYGRQLGSFSTNAEFKGIGTLLLTFIRAPYLARVGTGVETLCTVDGRIVAARQNNQLATAFHPELTDDPSVHSYFCEMVRASEVGTPQSTRQGDTVPERAPRETVVP